MTNSRPDVLIGRQEPRVGNAPDHHWSHADDAAFLSSAYGLAPDEWQMLVLRAWLGESESGRWTSGRCGLAVPRQNGKNGLIEVVELYKMVALGRKVLHTAHEVKTARKAFARLCGFFENQRQWPELAAMVADIRRTNGQEAVILSNGGSCEFVARSRGSARGFTVDDLVLDEAQELTDEQQEALLPTISAAPSGNPQIALTGTPPGPNSPGEVFTRVRAAGIAGDARLSWHEWSLTGEVDITDPEMWAASNPALGIRIDREVIEDELAQMSADGFARERLGMWAEDAPIERPTVFDLARWADLATTDPPMEGAVTYGVKFAPSGDTVALSVALRPEGGPVHVEGVDHRLIVDGTRWLVEWLAPRISEAAMVVVDGRAGAGAFVKALRRAGIPERKIQVPTAEQAITAHSMFLTATVEGTVSHLGDPALDESIRSAGKRPIGTAGGWGLQPIDDGDVTLAESAVLAHFAAVGAPRRAPSRGRRVVVLT